MVGVLITTGAVVLGLLITVGAALGVWAAFRTNRTATEVAQYKALAEGASATAQMWENRSQAIQAELDSQVRKQDEDEKKAEKALATAQRRISDLEREVSTLRGVVSAHAEIVELTKIVTALGESVRKDHERILSKLG